MGMFENHCSKGIYPGGAWLGKREPAQLCLLDTAKLSSSAADLVDTPISVCEGSWFPPSLLMVGKIFLILPIFDGYKVASHCLNVNLLGNLSVF